MLRHEFIEPRHRALGLAHALVGARKLVERGVAALGRRLLGEELLVGGDRFVRRRVGARGVRPILGAQRLRLGEAQVGEAPQRLAAQHGIGVGYGEERLVALGRQREIGVHGLGGVDRRRARGKLGERGRLPRPTPGFGGRRQYDRTGHEHRDGETQVHRGAPAVAPSYSAASANCACIA